MKTKLQQWGLALVAMGGASFILPAAGMQLRIFNLFGGASPAVSIGVMVLGGALWLIGTALGASARTQAQKPRPATGSAVPPPVNPATSNRNVTKCPKCGHSVGSTDRFCMECGNPIPQAAAPPPPPITEKPKRPSGRHVGLWVLLGFLLAAVMAVILGGAIAVWLTISGWRLTPAKTAAVTPAATPIVKPTTRASATAPASTPKPTPTAKPTEAATPAIASATRPIASATPAKTYFDRGHKEAEDGNYQKAIEDYTEAIRLEPSLSIAYLNRGLAYNKLNQYQNAISDLSFAIQLKPDAEGYYYRGLVYYDLKQYSNAISDFTKSIEHKPDSLAYYYRGIVYSLLKQYVYATSDFTDAIQLKPDALAYYERALIYCQEAQWEDAISDLSNAIQLKPDLADAYCDRGIAFMNLKQYNKGIGDFTSAIQIKQDGRYYYNRAIAYEMLGQHALAKQDQDKAAQLGVTH